MLKWQLKQTFRANAHIFGLKQKDNSFYDWKCTIFYKVVCLSGCFILHYICMLWCISLDYDWSYDEDGMLESRLRI